MSYAVVIADVRASTGTPHFRSFLTRRLKSLSRSHQMRKWIRLPYTVTAGDEFQTLTSAPEILPHLIFDLRRGMRPLDLWIGIGIGEISSAVRPPVNRLSGDAFRFARAALKSAPHHKFDCTTAFSSADTEFDNIADCIYALQDALLRQVSPKQWKAIDAYLHTRSVAGVARRLGVDVSTASRNIRRGHLWLILKTMDCMTELLRSRFS